MYSADFYHRPPQHHNTITLDPADTHFNYLNTNTGCWNLTSSSECSTNTVYSTQKNSAVFIYRMLLFLLRRVNYIPFLLLIIHFSFRFYVQPCACQCLIKNYLFTTYLRQNRHTNTTNGQSDKSVCLVCLSCTFVRNRVMWFEFHRATAECRMSAISPIGPTVIKGQSGYTSSLHHHHQ